ncbi:MAG: tetratricopeptide repeat protein [Cyanobacteria bacterium P01_D01_bin.105]
MVRLLHPWYQQRLAKLAYHRGRAHARQTAHTRAIASFTQAIELDYTPKCNALVSRGISYLEIKAYANAIADFEAVISAAGKTGEVSGFTLAQAHHYRGLMRQQAGNEAGALVDWSVAIAHHPTYPQPYYQRALIHLSQGNHRQALSDLDAAIKNDPALTLAYLHRGNLRHQLKDIPGAIADWEIAVCNDFTLEDAKQKLATVYQAARDAKLTEVLSAPLAAKGLTVNVTHFGDQFTIHVHRQLGTGINYYTLPDLIREQLSPLHLSNVQKFQLIGHLADMTRPEWNQTYALYKGKPCPPSNWQTAFSTLVVFPPFGIPAFIQAAQVKRFYKRGQYLEALSASKSVKGLCVAGSVALGFFTLLPLSYAAYDSMQAEPTFQIAKEGRSEESEKRLNPYQKVFNNPKSN